MKLDPEHLRDSLKRAQQAADAFLGTDDGGSCNFDSPTLHLPGARKATIEAIAESAGLRASKIGGGLWRGSYFVHINTSGQGMRRTRMAEAATASLKADGYAASTYYALD